MLVLYMSFIDNDNDKEKFEIIYNLYSKKMLNMAYSVLKNKEDSEDVVHETFIKIARNMKSIDEADSSRTLSYVLKATKNTAINLKSKSKNTNFHFDDIENISDNDFIEKLDIKNNYNAVIEAIYNLDDKYKDVLFYHFLYEMKTKDIANLLSRKQSTVKQQLVRGKKLLIETLESGGYFDW